ncbi:hypothetical protein E4T63_20025 [Pseudomonas fluorescens]|uniref:Uncharacterized protein n=1 Tax=Pseudomonas fluorescens TaxID=294 RepID=A0AAP9CK79_PSEFL|nr:hypothetical protein E3Z29_23310 [Pseudomonas sp. S150]QBX42746.1 hypothetical protein E4T63_20025 [Pseudomonas fluorescens]
MNGPCRKRESAILRPDAALVTWQHREYPAPILQCGSGLARESGLTDNNDGDWIDAFASKPAPTGTSPV